MTINFLVNNYLLSFYVTHFFCGKLCQYHEFERKVFLEYRFGEKKNIDRNILSYS